MTRAIVILAIVCLSAGLSYGMECSLGNSNFLDKVVNSCPGLLDSSEKSFCCPNFENKSFYCCDSSEFAVKSSWILLVVGVAVVVIVSLIVFFVSCMCCTCCPWYRRVRHRGTVYGLLMVLNTNLAGTSVPEVQVPTRVVHIVQSSPIVPESNQPYSNISYATNSAGMPQPPPYTNEMYGKQASYNPNY